jgi:hypothetical protein
VSLLLLFNAPLAISGTVASSATPGVSAAAGTGGESATSSDSIAFVRGRKATRPEGVVGTVKSKGTPGYVLGLGYITPAPVLAARVVPVQIPSTPVVRAASFTETIVPETPVDIDQPLVVRTVPAVTPVQVATPADEVTVVAPSISEPAPTDSVPTVPAITGIVGSISRGVGEARGTVNIRSQTPQPTFTPSVPWTPTSAEDDDLAVVIAAIELMYG